MRRRWWLYAPFLSIAVAGATLKILWPNDPQNHTGAPAAPPYLTIFMIDGLSQEVFEAELGAGRLPNIARLVAEGTYIEDGIGAFPSMTGYAFYPMLTGVDAAKSGILGLRWFDRRRERGSFRAYVGKTFVEMNRDLHESPKTLFEHAGEEHSFTVNSYCNRGAHRGYNTGFAFTLAKYKQFWWVPDVFAPDWTEVEDQVLDVTLADLAHRPKIQWVTFVSPDTYCHIHGLGPRYPELIQKVDQLIGRYRAESARLGIEDRRVYALVSDHGVESVERNLDLTATLGAKGIVAQRGIATRLFGDPSTDPIEVFDGVDAIVAINGNLMNHIYLRGPSGDLRQRVSRRELDRYRGVDLVALLVAEEGVEHVIVRGEERGVVELHRANKGVGFISSSGGGVYAYRVEGGADPLEYDGRLVEGDARAWLAATHDLEYPFAVPRLHAVMTSTEAPDLAVTSGRGYDLARDFELFVGNYRGGHGGLRGSQIRVPYVLFGPGIERGVRIEAGLAEDVGAVLFSILGYERR